MSAIGSVQTGNETGCMEYSPKVVAACCVALAVLAALTIALSAWGNVKIASLYGAEGIVRHSPYAILLPFALTTACAALVRALLIGKKSEPATEYSEIAQEPAAEVAVVAQRSCVTVSPTAGRCARVLVQVGDEVEAGAEICVIEMMKMELIVRAEAAGRVIEIYPQEGTLVDRDAPLFRLEKTSAQ